MKLGSIRRTGIIVFAGIALGVAVTVLMANGTCCKPTNLGLFMHIASWILMMAPIIQYMAQQHRSWALAMGRVAMGLFLAVLMQIVFTGFAMECHSILNPDEAESLIGLLAGL
jgi:hypothetical protein